MSTTKGKNILIVDDDEDFTNFYQELKNRSITNFNTDISKDDKILTLSSCYNDKLRVVLHAKLVSIQ